MHFHYLPATIFNLVSFPGRRRNGLGTRLRKAWHNSYVIKVDSIVTYVDSVPVNMAYIMINSTLQFDDVGVVPGLLRL